MNFVSIVRLRETDFFSGDMAATKKGVISLLAVRQLVTKNTLWISYQ